MRSLAKRFLTDSHLKAIGLVAAEWSYTELCLESLIWEIAGIRGNKGYAITTHIASETRINILSTLADTGLTNDDLKKDLTKIVARIRALRTERNNIVHSLWLSSKPEPPLGLIEAVIKRRRKPIPASVKITAKGKLNITNRPLTAKQILVVAAEIGDLVSDMYDLLERVRRDKSSGGIGLEAS